MLLLAQSSTNPPSQSQVSWGGGGVSNLFMRAALATARLQVLSLARCSSMLPKLYGASFSQVKTEEFSTKRQIEEQNANLEPLGVSEGRQGSKAFLPVQDVRGVVD